MQDLVGRPVERRVPDVPATPTIVYAALRRIGRAAVILPVTLGERAADDDLGATAGGSGRCKRARMGGMPAAWKYPGVTATRDECPEASQQEWTAFRNTAVSVHWIVSGVWTTRRRPPPGIAAGGPRRGRKADRVVGGGVGGGRQRRRKPIARGLEPGCTDRRRHMLRAWPDGREDQRERNLSDDAAPAGALAGAGGGHGRSSPG